MVKNIAATFRSVVKGEKLNKIEIVINELSVKVNAMPYKIHKYKKVHRKNKIELIELVDSGYSIVAVNLYFN